MKIRCLLLVEDEPREAAAVSSKLAASRLDVGEVVVATSLAQALRVITTRGVDVVLLDLDLGDSKSLATLRAVRAVTDAVVIVLSSSDDEVLGANSLLEGADDFLVKSGMSEECIRQSVLKCITLRQIRRVGSRIRTKMARLEEVARC